MKAGLKTEILDITKNEKYERYLYRCLASMPLIKYKNRREYLETAIPKGFHKKLATLDGEVVGQIEYAPAEASGFPIVGQNVVVMNCIWVLRRAKGHNLGKLLFDDIVRSEKTASGFATIALENHWSPWMRKEQMEKFGFKPIDSLNVTHKSKRRGERFTIHLIWLPTTRDAKPPTWDKAKLLEGVDFCLAHPLYRPQKTKQKEIFERY